VNSAQPPQLLVVERLHADRQPIDSAARKAENFPASKVPGLASSVISQSAAIGSRARRSDSSPSSPSADSRLGVPPPKKMLTMRRPQISGSAASRSAQQRLEIARLGNRLDAAGRLVRVEVAVRALAYAPGKVHIKGQRRQRRQPQRAARAAAPTSGAAGA
jgi:hypothetical protein